MAREMLCGSAALAKARGRREFFHGEVRKLDNRRLGIIDIGGDDQTGTSRQHSLLCILEALVSAIF